VVSYDHMTSTAHSVQRARDIVGAVVFKACAISRKAMPVYAFAKNLKSSVSIFSPSSGSSPRRRMVSSQGWRSPAGFGSMGLPSLQRVAN